LTRLS